MKNLNIIKSHVTAEKQSPLIEYRAMSQLDAKHIQYASEGKEGFESLDKFT